MCKSLNAEGFEITDNNHIGILNPFRYRSYYFDTETGFYFLKTRYYDPEIGRFMTIDDISYLDPESVNGLNLYAYCGSNPVNCIDKTGQFWDYVFDAVFLVWSIIDVIKNPSVWKNLVALGVDIIFAVIPFVPSGVGQTIKIGNKVDNAMDVANAINKIDNIQDATKVTIVGRNMPRVTDVAKYIGKADDLYKIWKGYDNAATGIKRIMHDGISMLDDARWMFGKLRNGFTVIDIGMTTTHKTLGIWYGVERVILGLWKTRNIWKIPVNYFL